MSRSAAAPRARAPSRPPSTSTTAAAAAPRRRLPRPSMAALPPRPAPGRVTTRRRAPAGTRPAPGAVGAGTVSRDLASSCPRWRARRPAWGKPSRRLPPYGSTPGVLPPRVVNSVPHGLVDGLLLASPLYVTTHSARENAPVGNPLSRYLWRKVELPTASRTESRWRVGGGSSAHRG